MTDSPFVQIFKHNNWANYRIIEACRALSDEQLDAEPASAAVGSIRESLVHLVSSQGGYLSLLTGEDHRFGWGDDFPGFDTLAEASQSSGAGYLTLARDGGYVERVHTRSGYLVEPWVVIVQIINHATEHREQIKSLMTAMGVEPPDLSGWSHGMAVGAAVMQDGD